MRSVHCYTSVSFSYLDRARVLAESVRKHHPDWTLWLLLSDEAPEGFHFDIAEEPFDYVVTIAELGIPEWKQWAFEHDVVELCTAVKGAMLCRLLDGEADAVVYLDPDTAVFAPLSHVVDRLAKSSVVLTPHLVSPETTSAGVFDNEIGSLKHGVYNLGFVAVRNNMQGREFAEWWRDRLLKFCRDDVANGLFTDQRWCDLVPALFEDVFVLRNPGYNVASWNLATRPIQFQPNGTILAGADQLRFFHFTKVNSVGEAMLERYSFGASDVFELLRWYRSRLAVHRPAGLPANWWMYGTYTDKRPIPRAHRIAWREQVDLRASFKDPFLAGPRGFGEWCRQHGL
ncbi:hypothetical protein [Paraburkholderia phenoliruptrix]|uniref:Uncharacterized protein n=2 Tax=Paraburkholderia phenoliruptrix TaxID=252970 RepID=K0DFT4_9BURK|nr:hypothetical protein [Paraburkholderia phenoliruptrix]AFT84806.1 hypothetical protein BUPH_08118 [Paraburkholderia phenoliruptrix BR3459a]CAB4050501.1 hypothetical protein LMG9964_04167 [Paraburkholderia phenoliruptrix]